MKPILLAIPLLFFNCYSSFADDKTSSKTITLEGCASVTVKPEKLSTPNGDLWLSTVECSGTSEFPKVKPQGITGLSIRGDTNTFCLSGHNTFVPCN